MSKIKVGIKIRPLSERDIRLRKKEQWIATANNSLECIYFQQRCNYTFDHVFGTKCDNSDVYASIVEPVVDSCINGGNGAIFTYGATSTGKNHTMMGTDKDPGIILYAVERLFDNFSKTTNGRSPKMRVAFVEILKEKIYNLLNDRKRIVIASNRQIDQMFSDEEIPVENIEKMAQILFSGNNSRKSSSQYKNKLSHAIFRITIESEGRATGRFQRRYLEFVHVASCEPVTGIHVSASLLEEADEGDRGLLWLNYVMDQLSEGKKDINFLNSTLTTILQESLTNSNLSVICNIKANAVEDTVATLKFANQAQNVRAALFRNRMCTNHASAPGDVEVSALEHQLQEIATVKVENLMLRKNLDEVKTAAKSKTEWFENQMKAAEFHKQKLEMTRLTSELQIKDLNISHRDLKAKVEALQKKNKDSVALIEKQKVTLDRLKRENLDLKCRNETLVDEERRSEGIDCGTKRKIDRKGYDFTNNMKILRSDLNCNRVEVESSTSAGSVSEKSDLADASHTMTIPNYLIGCIMGPGGSVKRSIQESTGTAINVSKLQKGDPLRYIKIVGTTETVSMAVDLITERVEKEKKELKKSNDSRP